ncbi:DUF1257 domain-containing protein [bacterium]|nr:DUF1257 domain-containing protein [bacterium]
MSKFVSLKTTLKERSFLGLALKDLQCEILKTKKIKTLLNRVYDVDIAVKTPFGIVGFIKNKNGEFELVGDDMILAKNSKFIEQLTQKYAYHHVVTEAKKAGFNLVKETVDDSQSVRLVLRKWR